jgi:hypothetical protein
MFLSQIDLFYAIYLAAVHRLYYILFSLFEEKEESEERLHRKVVTGAIAIVKAWAGEVAQ